MYEGSVAGLSEGRERVKRRKEGETNLVDHVGELSLGRVLSQRPHDSSELLGRDGTISVCRVQREEEGVRECETKERERECWRRQERERGGKGKELERVAESLRRYHLYHHVREVPQWV